MENAKEAYGVLRDISWTKKYYQQANRMAVLWFLNEKHKEKAHLLNICFTGDKFPQGKAKCPKNEAEWTNGINKMKEALGLSGNSLSENRIHYLYLPVTESSDSIVFKHF